MPFFELEWVEGVMKKSPLTFGLAAVSMFALVAAISGKGLSEAELTKQAKITKAQAQQIALAKVYHGVVKSAEIENEKGHLVWSFDIAKPNTKDITEIQVDAISGRIVRTEIEKLKDQAKEAAGEKAEKK